MRLKLLAGVAVAALVLPAAAHAQSTGTQAFENTDIVVTGTRNKDGVEGVVIPDTSKARQVLTQKFIANQRAGQSIDDIINQMPGVSFQNNDPYGSSGGTLTIHGFDASRVSQTFDGIPLNDTGNYALYSNQQLDSELIDQVNVSLGSTDIDSPTASATGSTVNYTTRNPTEDFHVRLDGSVGEYGYFRTFGVIDTGNFTPWGTRAWVSASHAENYNPFNHRAKISKQQYNAKLYQPIGSNGDFISIAGYYNQNQNSNFSSVPLRTDQTILDSKTGAVTGNRIVGPGSNNRFPLSTNEREYDLGNCLVGPANAGVADSPGKDAAGNVCGSLYDYSFNPSNNANIRINSKFTLADGLVLTVDPSYQFTKANGGSSGVTATEGYYKLKNGTPLVGYVGGKPYFGGVDLNGDGDTLDTVEVYAPSNTMTNRYGVIANLLWNISPTQTVRLNYTLDYGRHRQTGEVGYLQPNGFARRLFPIDKPILDSDGLPIEKRNRLSYAILNQVAGEYRGRFFDDNLVINLGVRAPFFERKLHNYCVTEAGGSGFVDCFTDDASQAAFLAANPTYTPPGKRTLHYRKVLPSGGFTYNFTPAVSVFASYSKGLQVASTDNLYNSFAFPADSPAAHPKAETTDNFEGGLRYKTSKVQAELSGWYTNFKNRLASSYDPIENVTVYRNLGTVHKYGIDGSVAYEPLPELTLYVFGSYLKSKILDNVQTGVCGSTASPLPPPQTGNCTPGDPIYALTAGKREAGSPTYTFGGRAQGNIGPLQIGIQAKRTGPRYTNDQNVPVYQSYGSGSTITYYQVYGAKTPAYTLVDLDARLNLGWAGLNDRTYLQLNVTNLFDKLYVGGFSGNTDATKVPFAYIGSPRAISATLNVAF